MVLDREELESMSNYKCLKSCPLNQHVVIACNYCWDPMCGKYQTNMHDDGFGVRFSTKAILGQS